MEQIPSHCKLGELSKMGRLSKPGKLSKKASGGLVKSLILAIGLLLVSLWAGPTAGQDYGTLKSLALDALKGDSKLGKMVLPILLGGLGLSPEQKTEVQKVVAYHRGPLEELFRQLQAANKELASQLLVAEGLSLEDVTPQVQRISRLREEILLQGLTAVLEVRGVLTPEQLERAVALKEQLRSLGGSGTP